MKQLQLILLLVLLLFLAACSSSGAAPGAIESYIQALADKDVIAATNVSCLAWEEEAYAEASSFEAVEVTLEGMSCTASGSEGDLTFVVCEGKIVADYGGELLDIELSQRTYKARQEQGDWKMCGYASN